MKAADSKSFFCIFNRSMELPWRMSVILLTIV